MSSHTRDARGSRISSGRLPSSGEFTHLERPGVGGYLRDGSRRRMSSRTPAPGFADTSAMAPVAG